MSKVVRITFLLGLLAPLSARADEDENWQRLRAMPRERRAVLSEKIQEFDRLDRGQKDAIRSLDKKLEELPAADRANYRSVLRRYHLWLKNLPEPKRKAIEDASPDSRIELVTKFRDEERVAQRRQVDPMDLRLADLRGASPYQTARLLKTWLQLSPKEQDEVAKLDGQQRQKRLSALADLKKSDIPHHVDPAKADEILKKLESFPKLKNLNLGSLTEKDKTKAAKTRQRIADNVYFYMNPPHPVDPENLLRFELALPSWVRSPFDLLPPEEARRRLTVLYRLIYPAGHEMPKTVPTAPPPTGPAARPKPAPAARSTGF